VPSPSAASAWLERFHDPAVPKAVAGTAFIPDVTEQLRGLWQVNADLTEAFRAAVQATAESEWKPLIRMFDGKRQETDQEWAEVCYVPNWAGHSRKRADYLFLAIREPLRQLPLGDQAQLPFSTQEFGPKGTYKLFGVVTNRARMPAIR